MRGMSIKDMENHPRVIGASADMLRHFKVEFQGHAEVERVADVVGRAIKPHRMKVNGHARSVDISLSVLTLGNLKLFDLQYDTALHLDFGELGGCTLIAMPIRGSANYGFGAHQVAGSASTAAVLSPQEPAHMWLSAGYRQLVVRIGQNALERACAEHVELLPEKGLSFQPAMDLTGVAGQAWNSALAYVLNGSMVFPTLLENPSYAERCERFLIDTLLFAQRSNCSDMLADITVPRNVRPACVKRAEEYMRENLAHVTSVEDIARAVHMSPRALFYAFRQTYDKTPMAYLRELRLSMVHAELKSCDPVTTRVKDVATRYGFRHYGHFASHYRRRFCARPQDTLYEAAG